MFLYRFDNSPELVEGWTTDKQRISERLGRIQPRGGTAMYDAVAEAVPLAQTGRHRKKALVVISDGNDTSSRTTMRAVKQMIRETEVLVYAIGIDSQASRDARRSAGRGSYPPVPDRACRSRCRFRCRAAGRRAPPPPTHAAADAAGSGASLKRSRLDDRVNVAALRDITDDSGGRTEIVRDRARSRSGDRRASPTN